MRTEHDIWIGKIDAATQEVGASSIVVDTGPWILGRKVLLPSGVIERIDRAEESVYVDRTKEQIKDAPELDELAMADEMHREELGRYYGRGGRGWQQPPHGV